MAEQELIGMKLAYRMKGKMAALVVKPRIYSRGDLNDRTVPSDRRYRSTQRKSVQYLLLLKGQSQ